MYGDVFVGVGGGWLFCWVGGHVFGDDVDGRFRSGIFCVGVRVLSQQITGLWRVHLRSLELEMLYGIEDDAVNTDCYEFGWR